MNLFGQKDLGLLASTHSDYVGFPTLAPWVLVKMTPMRATFERNPYYFKVDTAGNQLPYIDRVYSDLVADPQMKVMKIVAGEIDYDAQPALTDLSLFMENAAAGKYRVVPLDMHVTPVDVFINLTYSDPVWREVVRDIRFRKALNMGINREEIIDTIYFRFAELPTIVPTAYDPEVANQLLDEMGLDRRDAEGWRLGPDDKRFVFPLEVTPLDADIVPVAELMVEYCRVLGIEATVKVIEVGLWATRYTANELPITIVWAHTPLWWGASWDSVPQYWGQLWNQWCNNPETGEEPPALVKKYVDLIARSVVVAPKERQALIDERDRLLYENIFFIVLVDGVKYPLIASKKLGNIPHSGFAIAASFGGEQFFFKQ